MDYIGANLIPIISPQFIYQIHLSRKITPIVFADDNFVKSPFETLTTALLLKGKTTYNRTLKINQINLRNLNRLLKIYDSLFASL